MYIKIGAIKANEDIILGDFITILYNFLEWLLIN